MIPITRKEKYINEIAGGGNTAPGAPQTREELFYAAILGEVVAPSPITRAEQYLAKIANKYSGELPEPVTRIERFLARAAGMDVTIPTPVSREEMFWADYALIVEKETSGIPPLTFNAIAGTLKNYRIYGNTANGESVGDLVESGEHTGEYRVPVTVSNDTYTQTVSIYLPEQIKNVGDEEEYIDYAEQKMHRLRKNLLQNTAASRTINGVTFTVNDDGSVTCNGRREDTSTFFTIGSVTTSGETILSGCPSGGSSTSFAMRAYSATISNPGVYYDIGDSCRLNTPDTYNIDIRIQSKYTCDNLTFYPMIRKTSVTVDTYEPYIQDTELDVTLPALPTLSGTNTLSVETTVQPSKVMIKTGKFGTHKVRYYDSDGTFLSAEDVKDGTNARGFTPTKASTVQYNYTFVGWSTTKGSTTAETGVLNDITADKSLYAVFSQSLKTFTVYFYNGSTLLQTAENVQYGGTATYTGETPTKDGFTFSGWQPSNVNITADTSCYAQFVEG